jgi:hypothetical protein
MTGLRELEQAIAGLSGLTYLKHCLPPSAGRDNVFRRTTEILLDISASTESLFAVIKSLFLERALHFAKNKGRVILTSRTETQYILLLMSLEKNFFNDKSAIHKLASKYSPHWSGDKTSKSLRNVLPVAGLCWLWPIFSVSHSWSTWIRSPLSLPHIFNICAQQRRFD